MDALKKAEQAKQQGLADAASAVSAPDLVLEPLAGNDAPGSQQTALPELPKLEDLDSEFVALAKKTSQTSRNGLASDASQRSAVRNAFAVKEDTNTGRNFTLIATALGLLAFGVAGLYFWLQIKPTQGIEQRPAAGGNDLALRQPPVATPAAGVVAAPANTVAIAAEPTVRPSPGRQDAQALRRPRTERATAARPMPGEDQAIRFSRAAPGVDPAVAEGYQRLQANDLDGARTAYLGALRADPRNTDALHGMAAIAQRQGKTDDAAAIYQRILDVNPGNAAAEAALLGLNGSNDHAINEDRLKALLATNQGDQASVNFVLGNLYARENRWSEAQQAYFNAVGTDGGNPDYLFNLAVSLDHLRQPKLAAQYYRQALEAAESRKSAAFDRGQARARLNELAD